jgi:predicted RNA binding protein YcfA (HicA-like mRNA interferase family)
MRLHRVERDLEAQGWLFLRQKGSHRHYRNQATGHKLTIALHGGAHTALCWRHVAAVEKDMERLRQEAS